MSEVSTKSLTSARKIEKYSRKKRNEHAREANVAKKKRKSFHLLPSCRWMGFSIYRIINLLLRISSSRHLHLHWRNRDEMQSKICRESIFRLFGSAKESIATTFGTNDYGETNHFRVSHWQCSDSRNAIEFYNFFFRCKKLKIINFVIR